MLLNHGKVVFEDKRLTFEEFNKKKTSGEFPNG